ncbi:T-cell immunomodulatory protein isoform X1 [Neodiprion pinetum]|uniref:T-cell immunomodulatory protein isoform X1 n=2 Tax=Neodiprion lecontei TaxID=441921 RepID=A0ABM3GPC9_NEOLC|nr:T-cell immunomodulatory protein isoform X1 [Neodiprion pinetum]XP_046602127.1 T-cell immunomodulatory protein isoform X1 [Neodiprion lecontei]
MHRSFSGRLFRLHVPGLCKAIEMGKAILFVYLISNFLIVARCSDITSTVYGKILDKMPAAFGDFNSDELTDVFVIDTDGKSVEIMLAAEQEPLLRPGVGLKCTFNNSVTSIVPGDFDGDAFMDVFVTTIKDGLTYGHILWGGNGQLNCTPESNPVIVMFGQPLAIDYNQDMIIDLFGLDANQTRTFWIFNKNRTSPAVVKMQSKNGDNFALIRKPHSNAFLDYNGDFMPDLFITTENGFEIWLGSEENFTLHQNISLPHNFAVVGQSLFLDVELTGKMDLILPACYDAACKNSTIMIHSNGWHNLQVDFKDPDNIDWGFCKPNGRRYTDTITLRGGDFNMDGYPDLLATLTVASESEPRTFLLENVPCTNCKEFSRKFSVQWTALNPLNNRTVMAVFYDFYQDGILDVILIEQEGNEYRTLAFKNSLDYDANFVKVMVLTGLSNSLYPITPGTLGKKKRTYGTNLPGPSIAYKTTTQDGSMRMAVAAQLPQSAHFSLNLPYSTFGLGRTPNFIDTLTIGLSNKSREWTQIIPNSQMVVIPTPISEPSRWKVQLFVTPSKLILLSVAALTATCALIIAIIFGLYWKERREDKIEKLQEAHRFHFDAM